MLKAAVFVHLVGVELLAIKKLQVHPLNVVNLMNAPAMVLASRENVNVSQDGVDNTVC